MSSLYNSEPPTSGKVILKTTAGDFDIELWPKEAPKATRNFVQLCLEGYYDGSIFHRVLADFIAQTGDPTGTGTGGESIYGEPFKDEFHSRLRFIHRGLVACANENRPHSNSSQFFITLEKCEQLNRKNTIFGNITGESIYNLANLNSLETDDDDRPKHPASIKGTEVIWNPFEDIVPRTTPEERQAVAAANRAAEEQALKKARAARKAQKGLLSFAEAGEEGEGEDEDDPAQPAPLPRAMRSAHDAITDDRLLRDDTEAAQALAATEAARDEERRRAQAAVREALSRKREAYLEAEAEASGGDAGDREEQDGDGVSNFAARMRASAQAKRKALGPEPLPKGDVKRRAVSSDDDEDEEEDEEREGLVEKRRREQVAALAARPASIKPSRQVQAQDTSLMSEAQKRIAALKQQRKLTLGDHVHMKASLNAFKDRLRQERAARALAAEAETEPAPLEASAAGPSREQEAYDGKVRDDIDHELMKPAAWRIESYLEGEDEADTANIASLVRGGIRFAKLPKDEMTRQEDVDDYSVYDPKARGAPQEARVEGHWREGQPGRSPHPRPREDRRQPDGQQRREHSESSHRRHHGHDRHSRHEHSVHRSQGSSRHRDDRR